MWLYKENISKLKKINIMMPLIIGLILLAVSAIYFIFFYKKESPKEIESPLKESGPTLTQIENDFIEFAYEVITQKISKEKIQEAGKEELTYFLDDYFHTLSINYVMKKSVVFITNNISRLKSEIVEKFFEKEPIK